MWLTLSGDPTKLPSLVSTSIDDAVTQIGIERELALSLDKRGFAKLYRKHVCGASRREASRWAEQQIADRTAAARMAVNACV